MLRYLRFALTYALRNMRRDRQRTAFALVSIAAGVATVVALRALGLMLTDALTTNAQAFLRADVRVQTSNVSFRVSAFDENGGTVAFTPQTIDRINKWAASNNIEITYTLTSELMQGTVIRNGQPNRPIFMIGNFIDPKIYPFYDTIRAESPPGALLGDLFDGPNQVVIGKRLADQLGIKVGEQMRIGTAEDLQTVKGIVPDSAESTLDNPGSFFFSFVYIDRAEMAKYGPRAQTADRAYLKIPPNLTQQNVVEMVRQQWPRPSSQRFWSVRWADQVLRQNTFVADAISRFVLLLSLVGLVIGGVGIINTMLVAVNRRSAEIAVLKTLGLKGRNVSLIFMVEAVLSGFLGSLIGIVLGMFLSFIARDLGQQAFGIALPWRLYTDPMLIGIGLGVTITVFFSVMPTLMAGQVRPSLVLRQGNIPLARAGCLLSLFTFVVLVVGIGLLVDLIIGSYRFNFPLPKFLTPGIWGTLIVFLLLGLAIGLTWILVWLLGRLPNLRNPDIRLAIRGLTLHRSRTALSLLALIIGMTALSGTLIMTRSINILLYSSLSEPLGGNVIVLPLLPVANIIHNNLDKASGVNGYRDIRFADATRLMAVDGNRNFRQQLGNTPELEPRLDIALARMDLLFGVNVYGNPKRGDLVAGRFLGPEDNSKRNIVIPYVPELDPLGLKVGSKLTYRLGRARTEVTFEVVGMVAPDPREGLIPFSLSDSAVQAPLNVINSSVPFDIIIVDAQQEKINEVMTAASVLGSFVFDVGIFDSIISRMLNQLAALPLLVAGLSLFAAGALIATTVSLATMERRRQIGILKAVGVKRGRVLRQLLFENGIVGVAGGIISLLPTLLVLALVPAMTEGIVTLPVPTDLIALMLALSVVITLGATILTAWSAASEKPLTVLRYE